MAALRWWALRARAAWLHWQRWRCLRAMARVTTRKAANTHAFHATAMEHVRDALARQVAADEQRLAALWQRWTRLAERIEELRP